MGGLIEESMLGAIARIVEVLLCLTGKGLEM